MLFKKNEIRRIRVHITFEKKLKKKAIDLGINLPELTKILATDGEEDVINVSAKNKQRIW